MVIDCIFEFMSAEDVVSCVRQLFELRLVSDLLSCALRFLVCDSLNHGAKTEGTGDAASQTIKG